MKLEEKFNAINWLKDMILLLEDLIHRIHAWLNGELPEVEDNNTWPGRVVKTDSDAAEIFAENE